MTLFQNVKVAAVLVQDIVVGASSTALPPVAVGIDARISPGRALGASCGATPFPFVVIDVVCP